MTKKGLQSVSPTPVVLTPAQAKAWLLAAEAPHLPFTALFLFRRMRRNEIRRVRRATRAVDGAKIDFRLGRILIPFRVGKTNKRYITMHPTLIASLKWLKRHKRTQFVAPNINRAPAIEREVSSRRSGLTHAMPVKRCTYRPPLSTPFAPLLGVPAFAADCDERG